QYFLYLFVTAFLLQLAGRSATAVGASLYDAGQAHQKFSSKPAREQAVTIVVVTHNHESSITECLDSLYATEDFKLTVIVVDVVSADTTKKVVTAYSKAHPKLHIWLIRKRKSLSTHEAICAAKRYVKGKYVIGISGDMLLDSRALYQICVQ